MVSAEISRARLAAIVAAACVLGLSLRLYDLDRHGFWHDELATYKYVSRSVGELASGTALDPGHPPLYYILLRVLCGPGASDWGLRLPSVLAGAATIPVAALLAAALFGRRTAAAAALLVAASPFLITHSQEARMYAFLSLGSTVAALFAWRTLRDEHRASAVAYALVALLMVLMHFLGAVACVAHLLAAPFVARSRRALRLFLVSGAAAAVAFVLLWGWHVPGQVARDPIGWCEPSSWGGRATTLARLLIGGENVEWPAGQPVAGVAAAIVVTLAALAACAVLVSRRSSLSSAALFSGLLVLLPVGGMLAVELWVHPAYVTRFLTTAAVPLLVIIAAGAVRIPHAGLIVTATLLCAELGALALQRSQPYAEHWREAGAFVSSRLRDGDIVISATRNLRRYLPPGTPIEAPFGDWTGTDIDPERDATAGPTAGATAGATVGAPAGAPRAWVISEKHLQHALQSRKVQLTGFPLQRERFFETTVVLLETPGRRRIE